VSVKDTDTFLSMFIKLLSYALSAPWYTYTKEVADNQEFKAGNFARKYINLCAKAHILRLFLFARAFYCWHCASKWLAQALFKKMSLVGEIFTLGRSRFLSAISCCHLADCAKWESYQSACNTSSKRIFAQGSTNQSTSVFWRFRRHFFKLVTVFNERYRTVSAKSSWFLIV